MEPFVLINVLP